jgi:excisionase family DNA binding protein
MSIKIAGQNVYTVQEVAEALKITPQTVRAYIKQGRLKGQRVGRPLLISEDSLKKFLYIATQKEEQEEDEE